MSSRGRLGLPVLLLLSLVACSAPDEPTLERPLVDGLHEPDVLIESARLEQPPSLEGNRFLKGWFPWVEEGKLIGLAPSSEGAWLELVHLEPRRRSVILRTAGDGNSTVAIEGAQGEKPVVERLKLELPRDLPIGRARVRLRFSNTDGLRVRAARAQPVLPAGEVRFLERSIVQSPASVIDFVQDFESGAVLLGTFNPPRARGEGQEFAVELESGAGSKRVFAWEGTGPQELRISLPDAGGVARLRLLATGSGEPGRWEELRISSVPPEPQLETEVPAAPRLVVLYVLDALRADYVSHLGGPEGLTPTLDRLAAEGVTFARHISNAPNTKPSIKSLFIGKPFLLRGHERLPDDGPPTLADSFTAGGYRTMAMSASPWVAESFGTDRGFEVRSARAEYRSSADVGYNDSAERVHAVALEGLRALEPTDRGFFYLHTMHPHNPYQPPKELLRKFTAGIDSTIDGSTRTLTGIRQGRIETTEADRGRLRALYAAGLAYNDAELAGFLADLEQMYEPGEVLLIVTSDHGEELFEHDSVLHGYTLHREQLEIPLIFWWPGVLEPGRVEEMTDHLDLSATLRSLVTDESSGHGEPLWGLLSGAPSSAEPRVRFAAASSLAGGIFMAKSDALKLVWAPRQGSGWGMGKGRGRSHDQEYLFDRNADPEERMNLIGEGGLEEEWLRARLRAWVERGKLEEMGSDVEEQVDEETLERLRALGYVD